LRDADFAMYRAKQAGGNRFEVFDRQLKLEANTLHERERELRQVLDKREFETWFQPICRLDSGKLEGFESLIRWRREDGTIDSFRDLLPVAEETGLSVTMGRESLDTICRQLRAWADKLPESDLTLTFNLTPRQFFHPDIVAQIKRVLAATGADPSRLLVEVAESTLTANPSAAATLLQRIVDCEVRIAVDNFGLALAPLNFLVLLPLHAIKLAPGLAAAATTTGRPFAVLDSLIRLGRSLGVQVVAQGIETLDQLQALRRLGCELGQGHLLSDVVNPAQAQSLAAIGLLSLPASPASV
jgi:EAL domain-containing protein (putative c-di-GMP-specific phosphodiesterase class I)